MDHNESVRKFEHLMLKQADHARDAAIELEALVSQMPSEKSRQLAELQIKASHKQAKEFRELAQIILESQKQRQSRSFFKITQQALERRPLLTFDLMPIGPLLPLSM